jgi:NADH dehydrogenase/NADH:ubiquinone oxidoreductase subunit G
MIDGRAVQVPAGTSVFDAARINGVAIPTLCHLQSQRLWGCAGFASWIPGRGY